MQNRSPEKQPSLRRIFLPALVTAGLGIIASLCAGCGQGEEVYYSSTTPVAQPFSCDTTTLPKTQPLSLLSEEQQKTLSDSLVSIQTHAITPITDTLGVSQDFLVQDSCTGGIFSENDPRAFYVVTAKHCVETLFDDNDPQKTQQEWIIVKSESWPGFVEVVRASDIALDPQYDIAVLRILENQNTIAHTMLPWSSQPLQQDTDVAVPSFPYGSITATAVPNDEFAVASHRLEQADFRVQKEDERVACGAQNLDAFERGSSGAPVISVSPSDPNTIAVRAVAVRKRPYREGTGMSYDPLLNVQTMIEKLQENSK